MLSGGSEVGGGWDDGNMVGGLWSDLPSEVRCTMYDARRAWAWRDLEAVVDCESGMLLIETERASIGLGCVVCDGGKESAA